MNGQGLKQYGTDKQDKLTKTLSNNVHIATKV